MTKNPVSSSRCDIYKLVIEDLGELWQQQNCGTYPRTCVLPAEDIGGPAKILEKCKTVKHTTDDNASTYSSDFHEEFALMWRDQMEDVSPLSAEDLNITVVDDEINTNKSSSLKICDTSNITSQ